MFGFWIDWILMVRIVVVSIGVFGGIFIYVLNIMELFGSMFMISKDWGLLFVVLMEVFGGGCRSKFVIMLMSRLIIRLLGSFLVLVSVYWEVRLLSLERFEEIFLRSYLYFLSIMISNCIVLGDQFLS